MNRNLLKQFLIALALFLLGYITFNHELFAAETASFSAPPAAAPAFSSRSSDNP